MRDSGRMRVYSGPNPPGIMGIALDEAILRVVQKTEGPATLRVWEGAIPVVVLPRSTLPFEKEVISECRSSQIHLTRGPGGRQVLVYGPGVLSFSYMSKSDALTSEDLVAEVKKILDSVIQGIGSEASVLRIETDKGLLCVGDSVLGAFNVFYYFDHMLLQGALLVRDETNLAEFMAYRDSRSLTFLTSFFETPLSCKDLEMSVKQSTSQGLDMSAFPGNIERQEDELMHALHRWKYTDEDWIRHGIPPLALGKVLLEAYLAYPPTRRCRVIMAITDEIARSLEDKVELRIWMRGKGLMPWFKGAPPGLRLSPGMVQASKKHIVPAIIVDGTIQFEKVVPSYEEVHKAVLNMYQQHLGEKGD